MGEVLYSQIGPVDVEGGKSTLTMQVKRSLKSQAVSVGATATALPTTPLQYRRTIMIINYGSNIVFIGAGDVTTANGFPLLPRAVMRIDVVDEVTVYGIVATGTEECRILEGA